MEAPQVQDTEWVGQDGGRLLQDARDYLSVWFRFLSHGKPDGDLSGLVQRTIDALDRARLVVLALTDEEVAS